MYFICRDANLDLFYRFASRSILPALPFTFPPTLSFLILTSIEHLLYVRWYSTQHGVIHVPVYIELSSSEGRLILNTPKKGSSFRWWKVLWWNLKQSKVDRIWSWLRRDWCCFIYNISLFGTGFLTKWCLSKDPAQGKGWNLWRKAIQRREQRSKRKPQVQRLWGWGRPHWLFNFHVSKSLWGCNSLWELREMAEREKMALLCPCGSRGAILLGCMSQYVPCGSWFSHGNSTPASFCSPISG